MDDIVISGARVVDPETGTDEIVYVGIRDAVISSISRNSLSGAYEIDGRSLVLAPGFIDIHTHEDMGTDSLRLPEQTSLCGLRTGNTLLVGGNCGYSNYPVDAYLRAVERANLPVTTMTLVGSSMLRHRVGLDNYEKATLAQIARMRELAVDALDQGAVGVSFGVQYTPGTTFNEMSALASAAGERNKFFAVHIRYDTPNRALEAVEEVIAAAQITGTPLEIAHFPANVYGRNNIQKAGELIMEANRNGADISADAYPFDTWATSIKSAVFDNGFEDFNFRITDLEILSGEMAGEYCTETLFEKLRHSDQDTQVACHNAIPSTDIESAYRLPFVCVGSDSIISVENGHVMGHPRSAASPARFLQEFIRGKKLLSLNEGIKKLTLIPAQRLRLETGTVIRRLLV